MEEKESLFDYTDRVLMERYDRLSKQLESAAGKEKEDIEERLDDLTKFMLQNEQVSANMWSKQEEQRINEEQNKRMAEIEEKKIQDHLDVEAVRNQANLELEREKQKITWQKVAFEFSKLLLPIAVTSYLNRKTYLEAQRNMFAFEKDATIVSKAGREFHLPRIFK